MERIQFRAIIEILGRPPQHIVEGLNMLVKRMKEEKGVKIIEETHHAPVLLKDSKDLYTSFMELTVEVSNLSILYGFIFQYMPANIDIISPENLKISNQDMNQAANHLAQRMHQYDAITKKMIAERDMAIQKLYESAPHLFKKQGEEILSKEVNKRKNKTKSKKSSKNSKKK